MDDYRDSGKRMYQDAHSLYDSARYGTATHLFGLAAECAIKASIKAQSAGSTNIPFKHIPELIEDAKRLMSGRRRSRLLGLISHPDYMNGWKIGNRYWSDQLFSADVCKQYRDDAKRTLQAMNQGV